MKLDEKYVDVIESQQWTVGGDIGDGRVELMVDSPAGEDFSVVVDMDNFVEDLKLTAENFDVDEHVTMWLIAKQNGVASVPSARELIDDAEWIKRSLCVLAHMVERMEKGEYTKCKSVL